MGAAESHPVSEAFVGDEAYRVLEVSPGSPGHKAGLVQYLDFLVAVNGVRLVRRKHMCAHRGGVWHR